MGIIEIIFTSFGLAMDAFSASICKGLNARKIKLFDCIVVGGCFGFFQGLMPLLGYFVGNYFAELIINVDHWVVFVLLVIIGGNMILESNENESYNTNFNISSLIPISIATSIDALAMGITFSFLKVNILNAVLCIAIITFFMSFFGVLIGYKIGNKFEKKAQILGGVILIFLAIKILIEHIGKI